LRHRHAAQRQQRRLDDVGRFAHAAVFLGNAVADDAVGKPGGPLRFVDPLAQFGVAHLFGGSHR